MKVLISAESELENLFLGLFGKTEVMLFHKISNKTCTARRIYAGASSITLPYDAN